jgi:hypothetical protein
LRRRKSTNVLNRLDPLRKPKDEHIIERVLHERNEGRYNVQSARSLRSDEDRISVVRRQPLPPESNAFLKSPRHPVYYCSAACPRWMT